MNDDLPSVSGQAQRSRPADAHGGPGDQCCSNSFSGCTHGILISVQNGLTPASPLPPWEGQERMWLGLDDQTSDAPVAEGEPEVQIDVAAGEVAFEVVDGGVMLVIDLLGAGELDGVVVFAR